MANKKRKTLQIKRPDSNPPKAKKKPLPKVDVDEKAATSAIDTDDLTSMGPATVKAKGKDGKSNTARIALPDEDKIRRARRANATQDLEREGAMPSAEQIEQAQNSATMPIVIDTENIEESATQRIPSGDTDAGLDQTMEIDPDALATTNLGTQLVDADAVQKEGGDQTMQIDEDALATRNLAEELQGADKVDETGDQTLKIDEDELQQSLEADRLAEQNAKADGDKTMEIDADALKTRNLEEELAQPQESDKTMQIDPAALQTGNLEEDVQSMETMKMETMQLEEEGLDTELNRQEMEESFNAQTMEMDSSQLEKELANTAPRKGDTPADREDASKTMDLSQKQRPKTIMIKRPSREGSAPNAPTVKTARPDAATIKATRPVTAHQTQPKESTSRIDVPGEEGEAASKEGKTIKLRRPSGPPTRAPSKVTGVASRAGLELNEDGSVTALPKQEKPLGGAWLAVAIITLLVSAGALYTVASLSYPEIPMPGRLVDVNQQLIQR